MENELKILFITDNFPPESNAPASRTYEHCKHWINLGAEVTVITGNPNFPMGKLYEGYKNKFYHVENIDGIKVIRVWTYIAKNSGFFKRIIDYLSFAFSSFLAGLFVKTNVIIATSPQFFTAWSGCALSFFKRRPWVFEVRDLWPESINAVGAMENGFIFRILEKIELFLYRNATMIIVVTQSFKRNLTSRGINSDKIHIITNGIDRDKFFVTRKHKDIEKLKYLNGKFLIGYIGTHGLAHGLDFIVKCAGNLKSEHIHFLFVGDGAQKKELVSQVKSKNMMNVTFLDSIARSDVPDYISYIDVSLINLKKSDTFKKVIPSKIFEAAAMGIPILLGVEGEAKELVEKYNAGLTYEPENEVEFIKVIKNMEKNKKSYLNYKVGCKVLADDFDRRKLANTMYEYINSLVKAT